MDADRHYWVGKDEVEKLLPKGQGMAGIAPAQGGDRQTMSAEARQLAREALARLSEEDHTDPGEAVEKNADQETMKEPIRLWQQQMGAVMSALRAAGAKRVLALGCGERKLLCECVVRNRSTRPKSLRLKSLSLSH